VKEQKSDLLSRRKEKIEALKDANIPLFPNHFTVTHTVAEILRQADRADGAITEEDPVFSVAGRMVAINRFGKSSFIRFRDRTGQLQAYVRMDRVGQEAYQLFKQLDVGDFVGITGTLFQTKTGEWTLLAAYL
jgi:lysyl-tRNA synthetase class 2